MESAGVHQFFRVGMAEDMNRSCRRTMEDAHSFRYDFASVPGQGFFAIFDGHAGRQAAQWCGQNLHQKFESNLSSLSASPITELLYKTFVETDKELVSDKGIHSGCTAVVAFLRSEPSPSSTTSTETAVKHRRMLYTANVGDARAVLARGDRAVRLTYDHKGSDPQEMKRIIEAGGFIMNSRVNGVLAVTRSLGDHAIKELIVSAPFTTETELSVHDQFLVLACDGVWDVISDQDVIELVAKQLTESKEKKSDGPKEAAEFIVKEALKRGSTDNISCMIVEFCAENVNPQ